MVPVDEWADYRKAYSFLSKNSDSAFYYFNRSAANSLDKQQIASAYQSMAFMQSNAGDTYGAQESLTLSLKSLDEHDPKNRDYLARSYNGLGMSYADLNQYDQALTYYKLALPFADDPQLRSNILNNQGNVYKDLKSYPSALAHYATAIQNANKKGAGYASILTNQSITKWLADRHYNPVPGLLRSLTIRLRQNDVGGENSSYAHLAEYYQDSAPDSAIYYAQKMLIAARRLLNGDDELYALRKLIVLMPPTQSIAYFKRYQEIEDSLTTKRNAAKNQFAVIRYNVAEAKAENLALQNENTKKRYQLIAALGFAGLMGIGTVWWYRKRKQGIQLQAENKINESKFKLSQKVHDRVANGVYRIMSEVEHSTDIDKTYLLDQLDSMYEVSRNIAHDETEPGGDFTERVSTLLNAFKKPAIKLAVTGNEPNLWKAVSIPAREQLELVLQELMVNMSKHSGATQALIGFSLEKDQLKIEYRDNGIGLDHQHKKGKGLQNTVSRMKALKGSINFESSLEKGLGIEILVPLKK
jgi:tetratricopeptide (TPR) repeat protein